MSDSVTLIYNGPPPITDSTKNPGVPGNRIIRIDFIATGSTSSIDIGLAGFDVKHIVSC